jgi:hypothetical protein
MEEGCQELKGRSNEGIAEIHKESIEMESWK